MLYGICEVESGVLDNKPHFHAYVPKLAEVTASCTSAQVCFPFCPTRFQFYPDFVAYLTILESHFRLS